MSDFTEWLQQPWVQIVGWSLGAVGWIVGIVSGVLQVKGYQQQQRLDGAYQEILEQAQRDWRAKYTEDQVRDLTGQIVQLQQRIAEDVPKEARRVFLDDQLDALSESLGQSYERYVDLAAQRQSLTGTQEMPSAIMQSIEDAILPGYLERQKRQRALFRLTAAIFMLSVLPFVFAAASIPFFAGIPIGSNDEYPVGVLAVFLVLTAGFVYLGRATVGTRLDGWSERRPILYRVTQHA